ERDLARYRLAGGNFELLEVIRYSPAPGMLLTHERIIVEGNGALREWIGMDAPILQAEKVDVILEPRALAGSNDETFEPMRGSRLATATLTGLNVGLIFYCLVWLTPLRVGR